jgi:hypothetical protein
MILEAKKTGCSMKVTEVRWMRVSAAIGVGVLAVLGASTAYANWKWQQGVCVRYYPDGSEKMLYGKDCDLPSAPAAGEAI